MRAWLRRLIREASHGRAQGNTSVWAIIEEYIPGRGGRHRDGTWAGDLLERIWWEQREAERAEARSRLRLVAA